MTNRITIDRRGSLAVVTVSGCATCDADVPGNYPPAFTIELTDGKIHFHLCAQCVLQHGSPKRSVRERFQAALLAKLAKITADTLASERRAALHPAGGHA